MRGTKYAALATSILVIALLAGCSSSQATAPTKPLHAVAVPKRMTPVSGSVVTVPATPTPLVGDGFTIAGVQSSCCPSGRPELRLQSDGVDLRGQS
jgi:ABC-type uncharacterized transport system auxiliary subunit